MTDHKTRLAEIRARVGRVAKTYTSPVFDEIVGVDVPWLLAEVERLTKDNESLEGILSGLARAAKVERKRGAK